MLQFFCKKSGAERLRPFARLGLVGDMSEGSASPMSDCTGMNGPVIKNIRLLEANATLLLVASPTSRSQ